MVAGGVISILSGKPAAAHDLAPLSGPGDLIPRLGQMAPILSAAIAAVVAVAVVALMTARRLAPVAASIELLILGLAIDVCVGGATGRIAHSTDGGVMAATVACMMGGKFKWDPKKEVIVDNPALNGLLMRRYRGSGHTMSACDEYSLPCTAASAVMPPPTIRYL